VISDWREARGSPSRSMSENHSALSLETTRLSLWTRCDPQKLAIGFRSSRALLYASFSMNALRLGEPRAIKV